MAVEIVLPRLGWTMEEGTFVEWLKKDGDEVKPGDLIYVVESDKTTAEVENFDTGILRIIPNGPAAGARIPVGFLLAYVAKPGEVLPFESGSSAPASGTSTGSGPVPTSAPAPAPVPELVEGPAPASPAAHSHRKGIYPQIMPIRADCFLVLISGNLRNLRTKNTRQSAHACHP